MFQKAKKQLTIQMMAALEPEMLKDISEKKALKAFHTAAARVPAYKQLLKDSQLSPVSVKNIADFKKLVPVTDKNNTFRRWHTDINMIFADGAVKDIHSIISSSGHSGIFSYGVSTKKEIEKEQETIDFMLDYIFDTNSKKTILINCLPMGVRIRASGVTVAETSVRPDIALGVIKTFAPHYDQIILIGENSFVKKCLEDGKKDGLKWKDILIHLVLGEELLPENLRSYLADLLDINLDDTKCPTIIGSSFGIAELGLNIFYETKELLRIRRLLARDKTLREKLMGRDLDNIPAILHYNPLRILAEELPKEDGASEIVLTNLDENAHIPLVRYNTKDEGMLISFDHLKQVLNELNYTEYLPRIRMPLVAIFGRDKLTTSEGLTIRPEYIKELLYQDKSIACGITGNFKLSNAKAGLRIEIQMNEDTAQCPDLEKKIRETLLSSINAKTEIIIYPYREFPHGIELNYEKKFSYT